mmetsp:Transcript_4854/g.14318  ORF Transcript_4854/g.14318 Transcript_4854/m.14318 type:complete len:494 (-) Transcript_4854:2525-4006(-)
MPVAVRVFLRAAGPLRAAPFAAPAATRSGTRGPTRARGPPAPAPGCRLGAARLRGSSGNLEEDDALVVSGGCPADGAVTLDSDLDARDTKGAPRRPRPVHDLEDLALPQHPHWLLALEILELLCEGRGLGHLENVPARQQEGDALIAGNGDPAHDPVLQRTAVDAVHPHGGIEHRPLEDFHDLPHVHTTDLAALLDEEVVGQHYLLDHLVEDADDPHEVVFADEKARPPPLLRGTCLSDAVSFGRLLLCGLRAVRGTLLTCCWVSIGLVVLGCPSFGSWLGLWVSVIRSSLCARLACPLGARRLHLALACLLRTLGLVSSLGFASRAASSLGHGLALFTPGLWFSIPRLGFAHISLHLLGLVSTAAFFHRRGLVRLLSSGRSGRALRSLSSLAVGIRLISCALVNFRVHREDTLRTAEQRVKLLGLYFAVVLLQEPEDLVLRDLANVITGDGRKEIIRFTTLGLDAHTQLRSNLHPERFILCKLLLQRQLSPI